MADFALHSLVLSDVRGDALRAVTLSELIAGRWPKSAAVDADAPVPLVVEDRVEPGRLYDASDGGAPFAVPSYTLDVVDGRFTSSLRWRRPEDDPTGPIAFFTLRFHVALPSERADVREIPHQYTATLTNRVAVSNAAGSGAPMSMVLGALQRIDPNTAEVRLGIVEKAQFDALWQAITDPANPAEVTLTATVDAGRQTWRRPPRFPVLVGDVRLLHPVEIRPHHFKIPPRLVKPERAIDVDPPVAEVVTPMMVHPQAFHVPIQHPSVPIHDLIADRPVRHLDPVVALGRRPWLDDLVRGPLGRRPPIIIDDPQPEPEPEPEPQVELIRLSLPLSATVSAVSFPLNTNAYMFDVPGDLRPQTTRLLLRHEFDPGGDRPLLVYYEDTAFPDRFYYEPQGFRVPRDTNPPYLPKIRVAFTGVAAVEGDGATTVQYRARLGYTLVPDLDDVVLSALRRELATQHAVASPDLTALLPTTATLELDLPDDTHDLQLTPLSHSVSGETFDDGLADEIELSAPEFAAVVTLLQTDALRGTLRAELTGGARTSIPVSVSLRESAHIELHRTYRGPIPGGLVRVSVTNPLESPIQIADLYRSDIGSGAVAFPQSAAGLRVAAGGGAVDLDYRLVPDNADVADVVPALNLLVEADLRALLPSLLVNTGYADQTFPLSVSADAAFFGEIPPGAPGPLTGLLVQFECDVDVVLTATAPTAEVALRMPMLPWLLKDDDAQSYAFQVVNLHGAEGALTQGAVGPRTEGAGGGILNVSPAAG